MDIPTDDTRKKRLLWGVCLAWIPLLFLVAIGFFSTFRGISKEKATSLAALAGGLAEFFFTFGMAAILVFEVAAIILLLRTFSQGRPVRACLSVISILCSGFMLTILGFFLCWIVFLSHH